jgi:hypothetical protein
MLYCNTTLIHSGETYLGPSNCFRTWMFCLGEKTLPPPGQLFQIHYFFPFPWNSQPFSPHLFFQLSYNRCALFQRLSSHSHWFFIVVNIGIHIHKNWCSQVFGIWVGGTASETQRECCGGDFPVFPHAISRIFRGATWLGRVRIPPWFFPSTKADLL